MLERENAVGDFPLLKLPRKHGFPAGVGQVKILGGLRDDGMV
jgi:hypothetical protein